MDDLLKRGKALVGGIPEAAKHVREHLEWAKGLKRTGVDTKKTYDEFMALLFASFYSTSVQGRISGVASLHYGDIASMIEDHYVLTTKFKTNSRYGYQPVLVSNSTTKLLAVYLQIRPPCLRADKDPLWLSYSGAPIPAKTVSKYIIKFFQRTAGRHVTSTMLRSMTETWTESLKEDGNITDAQRSSVHAINGHTSRVCKDYYHKRDRQLDAKRGREVFETMALSDSASTTEHIDVQVSPDIASPSLRRSPWTNEELDYIRRWDQRDRETALSPDRSQIVGRCLRAIRDDPQAKAIFHPAHIASSDRLRTGFRKMDLVR